MKLEVSLFTVLLFKHGNGFQNTEWVLDTDNKTVVEINIFENIFDPLKCYLMFRGLSQSMSNED